MYKYIHTKKKRLSRAKSSLDFRACFALNAELAQRYCPLLRLSWGLNVVTKHLPEAHIVVAAAAAQNRLYANKLITLTKPMMAIKRSALTIFKRLHDEGLKGSQTTVVDDL